MNSKLGDISNFEYVNWSYDTDSRMLELLYRLGEHRFCERITYDFSHVADRPHIDASSAFRQMFLANAISYLKINPFAKISIPRWISQQESMFFRTLFLHGLWEYAHENDVDIRQACVFPKPSNDLHYASDIPIHNERDILVPIGGGKDSIVTIELLKSAGYNPIWCIVNPQEAMWETLRIAGITEYITLRRTLPQNLFTLNELWASNGHVPVTALVSLMAASCALMLGISYVAFANERSSSEWNTTWYGVEINHQYSKSFACEKLQDAHIRTHIHPDLQVFSLLRPMYEVQVAQKLSQYPQYHSAFRSCNACFRVHKDRGTNWCGKCPKCAFVFLLLAPFISRPDLESIFGANILADPDMHTTFDQLSATDGTKPFECVGTHEEVWWCLNTLAKDPGWADIAYIANWKPRTIVTDLFSTDTDHNIPHEIHARITW